MFPPAETKIKICGLTNPDDALAAVESGADFLGFIFHEASPRNVGIDTVAGIMSMLRGADIDKYPLCVGVFVNPTVERVREVMHATGIQAAQVHKTPLSALRELQDELTGSVYPAAQPRTIQDADPYLDPLDLDAMRIAFWLPQLQIDAYHLDLAGGTGEQADLALAARINERSARMMLAGGLSPANVADAVQRVRPWAVDVSGGVERAPGLKDHAAIRAFVAAVRAAN